jgi:hypothetical protein
MTDSAQDFRNVDKALKLLRAYRAKPEVPAQQNPAYQKALREIVEGMTSHEEFEAEMGRLVVGQVILANVLTEGLAENSGTTPDQVLDLYERQTKALIAQLAPE